MQLQHSPRNFHLPAAGTALPSNRLDSALKFLVVTYLVGVVTLSVEQFLALPQNLGLVDFWNMLFLPVCWWYLTRIHQTIKFPLALGMWLIFLGSLIATLFALSPYASIIVIAKEIYLYVWFVTVTVVLASLETKIVRRVLLAWTAVAVLHGILLVAEFVFPNFYWFMLSVLRTIGNVDSRYVGRVGGLFEDPVWAALFQLMGFVPLLLAGLRREWSLLLGMILLLSILATASLGALSALVGASAVAVFVLLLMGGHMKFLVWLATVLAVAAGLFLIILSQSPDLRASLEHLTTDRAAHTADERLGLWSGGTEALFSPKSILGVGPNNYRDFLENKTLHNDILEFGVERGLIGLLGLILLTGEAWYNAVKVLLNEIKSGDSARPSGVIFLAMLFAVLLESNAHQIFHFRTVWLGLAVLEAAYLRITFPSVETTSKRVGPWSGMLQRPEKLQHLPLTDENDSPSMETG